MMSALDTIAPVLQGGGPQPQRVVVLGGGVSSEAEISRASAQAVMAALDLEVPVVYRELEAEALPPGLNPTEDLVFPVMHGGYGEDGRLQSDLARAGFEFAGAEADACARAMDKAMAKVFARQLGLTLAPDVTFSLPHGDLPALMDRLHRLGREIVLKPIAAGSSVGLTLVDTGPKLKVQLADLPSGLWLAEPRLQGYDLTVGVVGGEPTAIVAIHPEGGVYDFAHKYTVGTTRYEVPASLPARLSDQLQTQAVEICHALGIRDFARVDFFRTGEDAAAFLEVNTHPGLTATSLLPKSFAAAGRGDFGSLLTAMLAPAFARFSARVR